ncbi:uncharacterized protein V1518DRAFT_189815 [Limtongia smithiae]|uniref:uncharacterized protein n=1 Tax=Limtongia smithiae TaxID=1125753 RepID=UPI0034CFEB36
MRLTYLLALLYAAACVSAWGPFHSHATPEYNTWDTKTIAQWLHDNHIKYTDSQSRDELLGLIRKNWDASTASASPFSTWNNDHIVNFLKKEGVTVKETEKDNREWLIATAGKYWRQMSGTAEGGYGSIKEWIFDTWSDSAMKRFLDNHHFGAPIDSTKDALLQKIKDNYDYIYNQVGATSNDATNWVFNEWSDSELAEWLTKHGYDVPRNPTRNTLIQQVIDYSRSTTGSAQHAYSHAQVAFSHLHENVLDASGEVRNSAFNTWSDSDLKEWFDEHGIAVPQPSSRDRLLASARRHKYLLKNDIEQAAKKFSQVYGTASENIQDAGASTKESIDSFTTDSFKQLTDTWSNSRLQEFLVSRGVIAPENTPLERLRELVWKNRRKPIATWDYWSFESWSLEDLQNWLKQQGDTVTGTRDQLAAKAGQVFDTLRQSGGDKYVSVITQLQDWYNSGKDIAFENWSDSDLKAYLDSYGVPTYQGSTRNELIAMARKHTSLFRHGADPEGWSKLWDKGNQYIMSGLYGAASGTKKLSEHMKDRLSDSVKKLKVDL